MKLVKIRNDGLFVFEREGAYFVMTRLEILTFSFKFLKHVLGDVWKGIRARF